MSFHQPKVSHNNCERLKNGESLALELRASRPEVRRWIRIAPFRISHLEFLDWMDKNPDVHPREILKRRDALPLKFLIQILEVDRSVDYHHYDIEPDQIDIIRGESVENIDEVTNQLSELGVNLESLKYPSECECPL